MLTLFPMQEDEALALIPSDGQNYHRNFVQFCENDNHSKLWRISADPEDSARPGAITAFDQEELDRVLKRKFKAPDSFRSHKFYGGISRIWDKKEQRAKTDAEIKEDNHHYHYGYGVSETVKRALDDVVMVAECLEPELVEAGVNPRDVLRKVRRDGEMFVPYSTRFHADYGELAEQFEQQESTAKRIVNDEFIISPACGGVTVVWDPPGCVKLAKRQAARANAVRRAAVKRPIYQVLYDIGIRMDSIVRCYLGDDDGCSESNYFRGRRNSYCNCVRLGWVELDGCMSSTQMCLTKIPLYGFLADKLKLRGRVRKEYGALLFELSLQFDRLMSVSKPGVDFVDWYNGETEACAKAIGVARRQYERQEKKRKAELARQRKAK